MNTVTSPIRSEILTTLACLLLPTWLFSQALIYSKNIGNTSSSGPRSAIDLSGNRYIFSHFQGTVDLDPGPGTQSLAAYLGSYDVYLGKFDSNGDYLWHFRLGDPSNSLNESSSAITTDNSGNVYIAGSFNGTIDFDPGPGTSYLTSSPANHMFVAKYNSLGVYQWAYATQNTGSGYFTSMSCDNLNNIILTGAFTGTIDFDFLAGTSNLVGAPMSVFVAKYSSAGVLAFAFKIGTSSFSYGRAVCTGTSGDIYVAGEIGATADFDPGAGVYTLTPAGGAGDAFVAKYSSGGTFQWAGLMGGTGNELATGISCDNTGNVFVSGAYQLTSDFDSGPATASLTSGGSYDAYLVKYSSGGLYQWVVSLGGAGNDFSYGCVNDASGNIWITGIQDGSSYPIDFDPGAGLVTMYAGHYAAKYSSSGAYADAFLAFSGSSTSGITSQLADGAGYLYLTGTFSGNFDFNPGPENSLLSSASGNVFYTKYGACSFPSLGASPVSQTVCAGSTLVFTIAATGSVTSYRWEVDQGSGFNTVSSTGIYSGATTPSLTLTGVTATQNNYIYRAIVNGVCYPSVTSSTAQLVVNPVPAQPAAFSSSTPSVCVGQANVLYAVPLNTAVAYAWTFSGSNATLNPSSGSVSINFGTAATSGTLAVTATNNCGSSSARTIAVTVNPGPALSLNSGTICSGASHTFIPSGASTYTITGGQFTVSPVSSSSYSLTGTSLAGCVSASAAVAQVSVFARPLVSINSGSICSGQSHTFIPGGASTYTITGSAFTVMPGSNSTYSVSGTSTAGCVSSTPAVAQVSVFMTPSISVNSGSICIGESFTMNPAGASSYTYSGGSQVVSPASGTFFTVSGTSSAGCTSTASAISTVTVHALPLISANSGSVCSGSTFVIQASGASTYSISGGSFTVSPSTSTFYTISGTSSAGCVSTLNAIADVTVFARPLISLTGGTICSGQVFTLTPAGAVSYTFTGGSNTVSPQFNTTYSVTGTSSAGCTSSAPAAAEVTVHTLPLISASSGSICAGRSFSLFPTGALTYTISGGSAIVSPQSTSSYSITGTNAMGCVSASPAIASVTVLLLPDLQVNGIRPAICAGESITLSVSGAAEYTWSGSIQGNSIVITPSLSTSYTVSGISPEGCQNSTVVTQAVDPCTTLGEQQQQSFISVYPNPVAGELNVQLGMEAIISVWTLTGALLLEETLPTGGHLLDISHLAPGFYLLRVEGTGTAIKILKN